MAGATAKTSAGPPLRVLEGPVADLELPGPVPLRGPRLGQPPEQGLVADLDGVALHHHVQAALPAVAPGGQDYVRAGRQVAGFLLGGPGAEVQRLVQPHRDQRGDVRPAVGPDGGQPEQLGLGQHLAGLGPPGGRCGRFAVPLVERGHWGVHLSTFPDRGHGELGTGRARPGPRLNYCDARRLAESPAGGEAGHQVAQQLHSFLATSGPVMRASSGKVAAMMPRAATIPPPVSR